MTTRHMATTRACPIFWTVSLLLVAQVASAEPAPAPAALAGPGDTTDGGPQHGDAGAPQEAASGEAAPPAPAAATADPLETPEPTKWLPSKGRQCQRYRRRRVCDGPRKVPEPHGPAAELANKLGLGTRRAASTLLTGPPEDSWVMAVQGAPPTTVLSWPVPVGKLWRGFGPVVHRGRRRFHKGVDIGGGEGAKIRAVADGLVAYSDNGSRGYGNLIMVVHADGSVTFYAHCRAAYVFPGQQVLKGQVIGEVGTTGITQGAHLHFELRMGGRPTDPLPRFDQVPRRSRGKSRQNARPRRAKSKGS